MGGYDHEVAEKVQVYAQVLLGRYIGEASWIQGQI